MLTSAGHKYLQSVGEIYYSNICTGFLGTVEYSVPAFWKRMSVTILAGKTLVQMLVHYTCVEKCS